MAEQLNARRALNHFLRSLRWNLIGTKFEKTVQINGRFEESDAAALNSLRGASSEGTMAFFARELHRRVTGTRASLSFELDAGIMDLLYALDVAASKEAPESDEDHVPQDRDRQSLPGTDCLGDGACECT